MKLSQVAKLCHGELIGEDVSFSGASIDTRVLQPGQCFFALQGVNSDGHAFVPEALKKKAACAVVSSVVDTSLPMVRVDDVTHAMGLVANAYRRTFDVPFIGVTGSAGKTTTKTMIGNILNGIAPTLVTKGNYNNHWGMPLTLLSMEKQHKFAVIEMGANAMGEIAYLTNITQPNVALITTVVPCHVEGFGSVDNIAKGKGEIFQGLPEDGTAILNADSKYHSAWVKLVGAKKYLSFSTEKETDVYASHIQLDDESHAQFTLHYQNESVDIILPVLGKHNVINALAASAACIAVGVSLVAIKQGLETVESVDRRLKKASGLKGSFIIDDSYNANPASMKAALEILASAKGRKLFAVGDMGELGSNAVQYHQELGHLARQLGIDFIYAQGDLSQEVVKAFGNGAMHFSSHTNLIAAIKKELSAGDTVLVKGSLFTGMGQVSAALIEE